MREGKKRTVLCGRKRRNAPGQKNSTEDCGKDYEATSNPPWCGAEKRYW